MCSCGDVTGLTGNRTRCEDASDLVTYSTMVGTTDQLTAAMPGGNDNRITICSTVSCFEPEVITSARTLVRFEREQAERIRELAIRFSKLVKDARDQIEES